jgi:hypothetical protein
MAIPWYDESKKWGMTPMYLLKSFISRSSRLWDWLQAQEVKETDEMLRKYPF